MKKAIIVLAIMIAGFLCAEPVISHYEMGGVDYQVEIGGDNSIYISVYSESIFNSKPHMVIDRCDIGNFRTYMGALRDKYEEWNAAAKANGVKDLVKEMKLDVPIPPIRMAWIFGNEWHMSTYCFSARAMYVLSGDGSAAGIWVPALESTDNQYITYDSGACMLLMGREEIDGLVDAISEKHITAYREKEARNGIIFK